MGVRPALAVGPVLGAVGAVPRFDVVGAGAGVGMGDGADGAVRGEREDADAGVPMVDGCEAAGVVGDEEVAGAAAAGIGAGEGAHAGVGSSRERVTTSPLPSMRSVVA